MKWLAPLLAILIVCSGISPCLDHFLPSAVENHCAQEDSCMDTAEGDHDGEAHSPERPCEEKDGDCSDDCNCFCCAHPILPAHQAPLPSLAADLQIKLKDPSTPPVRDFPYLIWRPPQWT